mgnify:CR=1 FL=1
MICREVRGQIICTEVGKKASIKLLCKQGKLEKRKCRKYRE